MNGDGLPDHWLAGVCVGPAAGISFNIGTAFQRRGAGITGQAYRENDNCAHDFTTGPEKNQFQQFGGVFGPGQIEQATADVNGDGWVDVLWQNTSGSGPAFYVYFGLGDGSFLGWGQAGAYGGNYPEGVAWYSPEMTGSKLIRSSDGVGTNKDILDVDGDGLLDHRALGGRRLLAELGA